MYLLPAHVKPVRGPQLIFIPHLLALFILSPPLVSTYILYLETHVLQK